MNNYLLKRFCFMQLSFIIKIFTFLLFVSFNPYINAYENQEYIDRDDVINYVPKDDVDISDDNKVTYLEKELRLLINRIELLEYKLSTLENKLSTLENTHNNELLKNKEDSGDDQANNNLGGAKLSDAKLEDPHAYAYDIAIIEFKKNNFLTAQNLFKKFIDKYPNSHLISNAYFWYADTFFKQNKLEFAAINYLKGYHTAPKGAKALESLLQGAASLGALKKSKEACGILNKISTEFPNKSTAAIKRVKELSDKFGCKVKK